MKTTHPNRSQRAWSPNISCMRRDDVRLNPGEPAARAVAAGVRLEAALWLAFLGPFFFLVYGGCNWITSLKADVGTFYWEWERWIPFVPVMIVPYMSIDAFFAVAPFLCRDRRELHTLVARIVFAIGLSAICFLLFPLRIGWDRPEVSGWLGAWFAPLNKLDQPFNLAPSLHISLRSILWMVYRRHTRGWLRRALGAWFVLVGVSTVAVFQHHVIDVLGGYAVAVLVFYLMPGTTVPGVRAMRVRGYEDGRVGMRYAGGALAVATASLVFQAGNWLLLWVAVAMLVVATGYFGFGPAVFRKADGRVWFGARVLLAPYLLGAWISWRLHARRIAPWAELGGGVLIGRKLTRKEANELVRNGVVAVLDLTAELSETGPLRRVAYRNLAVLDLTEPTLEQVQEAVRFIDAQRQRGRVFVHCALGCGRAAGVAAAWLLASGAAHDLADAVAIVRAKRPGTVTSAGMLRVLQDFQSTCASVCHPDTKPEIANVL